MPYFLLFMKDKTKEIIIYGFIILVIILIRTFIITPIRVNGTSMDTTLQDKEIMILNKINYKLNDIERFDIVVIKKDDSYLIKRIIGLPGETLKYVDDKLYINDKEIKEYFKNQSTQDFNIIELGYDKIPNDCYFAIGDNRKDSLDSRIFGCFKKEDILGSANLVLLPLNNFGYKK